MSFARAPEAPGPTAAALSAVFNDLFEVSERTILRGGASEPLYEPAAAGPAVIHFRADYGASALHEVAHWCIAGRARRRLVDYGYWYAPDGRSLQQQADFLRVEARPQALEWCFAQACGLPFRISLDNLAAPPNGAQVEAFARAVVAQGVAFYGEGLPPRAKRFFDALAARFRPGLGLPALVFSPRGILT